MRGGGFAGRAAAEPLPGTSRRLTREFTAFVARARPDYRPFGLARFIVGAVARELFS